MFHRHGFETEPMWRRLLLLRRPHPTEQDRDRPGAAYLWLPDGMPLWQRIGVYTIAAREQLRTILVG